MGRLACTITGFCVALALGCSDPGTSSPPGPTPPSELEVEIDRRIEEAALSGFSGAALITVDGQQLVASGHGLADRPNEVDNTKDTAFDVGSILKTFTAAAIFELDAAGVLDVSDRLDALFSDVPPDKAGITLLEIIQHRAGFDEYHDTMGDFEPMTETEARQAIFAQELLFVPGTDEAYSNSGYTLLADVIQTVSGQPYVDYIREKLFEPAGMDHTGFYSEARWQTVETAIGYDADTFGDNDPATWPYTWALVGNGGLVTSVVDLDRFVAALRGGRLLAPSALEAMRAEYLDPGAAMLGGQTVYGEAGAGDYGLGGVVIDVPARQTRIVMATNTYDVFDIEGFAVELVTWLLERE